MKKIDRRSCFFPHNVTMLSFWATLTLTWYHKPKVICVKIDLWLVCCFLTSVLYKYIYWPNFLSQALLTSWLCFPSQSASSCFVQLIPVGAQRQPTGNEQHPEPRHHASLRHICRGGRWDRRTQASAHSLQFAVMKHQCWCFIPSNCRWCGLQPAAHSSQEQQHRHQAVLQERGVSTHCPPAGDPRETQIPC